jgi:hypothetical protein
LCLRGCISAGMRFKVSTTVSELIHRHAHNPFRYARDG